MAKNIFTAVDPQGRTHKRYTSRTYVATVVYKLGAKVEARDRAAIEDGVIACHGTFWAYEEANSRGDHGRLTGLSPDHSAQIVKDAKEFLAHYPTHEAYMAKCLKAAKERHEEKVAAGEYTTYQNAGWTSRPDLAAKLASTFGGQYRPETIALM